MPHLLLEVHGGAERKVFPHWRVAYPVVAHDSEGRTHESHLEMIKMKKDKTTKINENRLRMNEWYRKNRPLRQTQLIVTGVDESVRTMGDLLTWRGGPNHAVLRVMSACADLQVVHLGNSVLAMGAGGFHPLIEEHDLKVEFHPTISKGLLNRQEAPFAWIHVGHGDYDGSTAFLSDGPEGEGPYLESESIAVALESMKGICSLICLPVCHSHYSKIVFDACKNTLLVNGSARDYVTEIESQCEEACIPYSLLKSRVKSEILV